MKKDKAVLIGNEFWEKIGGLGTYQAFIDAVNEIGKDYKDRNIENFSESSRLQGPKKKESYDFLRVHGLSV